MSPRPPTPRTAAVLRGDARHLPLADASVDLIVTSPPYFALRSYTDDGQHYAGQLGAEATPAEYIAALIECTREWMRVLKPTGSMFVNLGDKYAQDSERSRNGRGASQLAGGAYLPEQVVLAPRDNGTPRKSLIGLPWRYAIACIDDLRLILRAELIWSKPNGLPESVTDRVRRSHEQWFHLVKAPHYYSAVDAIREAYAAGTAARYAKGYNANDYQSGKVRVGIGVDYPGTFDTNPLGKLPGSVWDIATEPLTVPAHLGVDHFAAFPTEWPRRLILGWSPSGICTACGQGRRPVAERSAAGKVSTQARGGGNSREAGRPDFTHINRNQWQEGVTYAITGEACACPDPTAPTRPAVVLDPFGGTGTTALVAATLGRHGITVDMSADYSRLATWRTTNPSQLAKAMQVPAPPKQIDGQLDLLAETA